ncbi:NAD-P-binding protein [Auriscalpium vulgare]|uniref:NAD-P-binding protein n=1 Tax=Auriscalpium vulgare TaxID=40419 RepID=A0ACB8RHC6_9AGAM|nr:NAD-P-binding protein [Auriscalpium vulgare]
MSGFKKFVVLGAGNIGTFVAEELLKEKAAGTIDDVLIFTRPDSAKKADATKLALAGATIVPVDYADSAALTAALTGVHVVISTLPAGAIPQQNLAARAAHAAGVQLFAPSEFGDPSDSAPDGPAPVKAETVALLKELGLPYALFYTGPLSDFVWISFLGLDIASGKVTVAGDGNAPISWTTRRDVARFIAYTFPRLPAAQLQNRAFRLEGERKSFNQVFEEYRTLSGKPLAVTYTPLPELDAQIAATDNFFAAFALKLAKLWGSGGGIVGTPDNGLYPGWNPAPAIEGVKALAPF